MPVWLTIPDGAASPTRWVARSSSPMLWVRRHVAPDQLPPRRVVIGFRLRSRGRRSYWLVGAVTPRDAQPELVRRVFEDAVGGSCLLPIEVVQAPTSSAARPAGEEAARPTPQELGWLRQLAGGTTVGRLAHEAGYSEQAMFRLLRELYRKIGARNRTEALVLSSQRGWL
jgi:DNA-binding CsgD family transcriptional regulator